MHSKAVILAAGQGTRLAPLTPSFPKELLPIGGFPAIHHVVYEMAELGVSEVLIVLSEGKEAVRDYFTKQPKAKGDTAMRLAERYEALLSRIDVSFVHQSQPRGTGDAVLLAEGFMGNGDLIVAYPDDLILLDGMGGCPPKSILSCEGKTVLLTRRIPRCEAEKYGVILPDAGSYGDMIQVRGIMEKPRDYPDTEALALVGRMRLTKECVREISRHPLTDTYGITLALNAMAARGKVCATTLSGTIYDVGTHEGYMQAIREISKKIDY